ncbi:hypothetical protein NHX12_000450, partial [Muraenolepis orangiensis]
MRRKEWTGLEGRRLEEKRKEERELGERRRNEWTGGERRRMEKRRGGGGEGEEGRRLGESPPHRKRRK